MKGTQVGCVCLWLLPSLEQKVEEKREGAGRRGKEDGPCLSTEQGSRYHLALPSFQEEHFQSTPRLSPEYDPFAPAGSGYNKLLQFIIAQQPAIDTVLEFFHTWPNLASHSLGSGP